MFKILLKNGKSTRNVHDGINVLSNFFGHPNPHELYVWDKNSI